MKKILLSITLLAILVITGCQNKEMLEQQKEQNDTKSLAISNFPKFKNNEIKKYTYQALDYFKGKTCNESFEKSYENYLKVQNIDISDCSHDIIKKYNDLYKKIINGEDLGKYLLDEKIISKETYIFTCKMIKEISQNPDDYNRILDKYINLLNKNKIIEKNQIDRLATSIFISKYTFEYFEKNDIKGLCNKCIKDNKAHIFGGIGIWIGLSTLGCLFLVDPVPVIACIVSITSAATYAIICTDCYPECNFCIPINM